MTFSDFKYKANYYVLVLLIFVIPLERRLAPPLIILFLISSIVNHKFKRLSNHKILFFTSLFILYLFGLVYSENTSHGIINLVEKLSLFVFPLSIYISNINFKEKLNKLLESFVDGCFISGTVSLLLSTLMFYFTLDFSFFYYDNSSYFLHTSYFSMFANFSILILYYLIKSSSDVPSNKTMIIRFFMITFFSILILLSASKTGILSLIIIHISAISYWVITKKMYLKGGGIFIVFILIGGVIFKSSSTLQKRVDEMVTVVFSGNTSGRSTTAARVEIWKLSKGIIAKKPIIGYGTGDEKKILVKFYTKFGFLDLAAKQLNAHNQFIQTTIAIGLTGGLVLLLMLLFPLFLSIKKKHYLYASFILIISFNFLTESMLERQSGIVFYTLFNALFFMSYFDEDNQQTEVKP